MYSLIRPCAYEPDPDTGPWVEDLQLMTFAEQWRAELTGLYALGWRSREPFVGLPVRKLNSLLRAVAPGVLATGRGTAADSSAPWIYAQKRIPADVILPAFLTWVSTLRPESGHRETVARVLDSIGRTQAEWTTCAVELSGAEMSPGGTGEPHRRLYALLPELLALRLAARPFRAAGAVTDTLFRVVSRDQGAELVAWPPQAYREGGVDHFYSALLTITLQSVPFTPGFRVHVSSGIRRWSTRTPIWLPEQRGATVLFDTPLPWEDQAGVQPARLVGNTMEFDPRIGRVAWRGHSSVEILADLDIIRRYPKPEDVIAAPRDWLDGQGDIAAGVVHGTAMGTHKVGAGLMPGERALLDDWVAEGLRPYFRRVSDMTRAFRVNKPVLLPKVPKKDVERRTAVELRAVSARRAALRAALAGEPLHIDVVTAYPETKEHLMRQLGVLLGVAPAGIDGAPSQHWSVDGLEIHVHLSEIESLGNALTSSSGSGAGTAADAVRARRAVVASRFPSRTGQPGLALVELPGADRFKVAGTDPKFALRLGFADTGRLSQFIETAGSGTADLVMRASAAWLDGFRQLGACGIPAHQVGVDVPADLQYVALWVIRKQATTAAKRPSRHLVAVRIRPLDDAHPVQGWDDDRKEWVPYAELLISLASNIVREGDTLSGGAKRQRMVASDERADVERRIRTVLFQIRDRPTLLLVNAGNTRDSWRWLSNGNLVKDKLGFTDEPSQWVTAFGSQLRVVLLRDRNNREEVPQWYAPGGDNDTPGFGIGLWIPEGADHDNRVFASTADLPKNFPKIRRGLRKIGREEGRTSAPTVAAWNPQYLELVVLGCRSQQALAESGSTPAEPDRPTSWAALTHQLRFHDDYVPLVRPLPMHMAKLAEEYLDPTPPEACPN
ncbi:pPIWI_RE module domain-containing protein [Actinokineospora inagensis]|uniref:pPIWI_RE module domain-containing protein n=1 Tax=Actinokineospora inagensis TaxID=103730 RepID=UPI00041B31D0|nr:DUF3962 domain-containing protein [Actinokineospora inagensis]